jgi:hypothetical protein
MGICEDRELDRQLTECLRNGPVQLVNNPAPRQPSDWVPRGITADPNDTCQTIPHTDVIRERLRAGAKDEKASPEDRAAATVALRVMYRE